MASMAIPFNAVEERMTFVGSGVNISETMHDLSRFFQRLVLTPAFYDVASELRSLVALLDKAGACAFSSQELLEVAGRLDRLVEKTNIVTYKGNQIDFALWSSPIRQLEETAEKLDSLAESYRLSASDEFTSYVSDLVTKEGDSIEADSWRDFVATLQD